MLRISLRGIKLTMRDQSGTRHRKAIVRSTSNRIEESTEMNRRELQHTTDINSLVSQYDVENQDPKLPDGYHLEKLRFYAIRIVIRNHSLQDILNPEKELRGYFRGDSQRSLSEQKSVYPGAHRNAQISCLPLSTYQDPIIRSNLLPRHGSQTVTAVLSSCSYPSLSRRTI